MQLQSFPARFLTIVLASALAGAGAAAEPPSVSTRAIVVFNTVCARCHEGECSGRLSFDESFARSRGHMARHYPPAEQQEPLRRGLFTALAYMKDHCAYYPMPSKVPPGRTWNRDQLESLSTGDDSAWFVPAGRLAPGRYRLQLDLAADRLVTVQLTNERFETAIENCYDSHAGQLRIPFTIDDAGNYYVRLYVRRPVTLTRLAIRPE